MSSTTNSSPVEPVSLDELLLRQVAERPDALAIADAPNRAEFLAGDVSRWTWVQVNAAVDTMVGRLVAAGANPGSVVAVQLPNSVELAATLLACFRLGAVCVPFPVQHREHELQHGFSLTEPKVFVTAQRPDREDQLDIVDRAVDASGRAVTVLDILAPSGDLPLDPPTGPTQFDEVATICWTSGTTGTPKGVPRKVSMWLASGGFQVDRLGLGSDDRILCPFPLVNMAGIGGILIPWLMTGSTIHLHQPLNLPVFLQQVAVEQITYTVAPPAILNMLLLRKDEIDLSVFASLRKITSGAAPLDPWMVEGWAERDIEIVNVFGSNEGAALLSTADVMPDPATRAQCFPQPDPVIVETRLVDLATGEEITEVGIHGELRFRGSTVFEGYLESTGEEFDDQDFYRTGDVFEWVDYDSDPRLMRFVDRAKDIVVRGGMNISAAEVEALVVGTGLMSECAVIGIPDVELGERVGLVGVAAGEAAPSLDDVVSKLREVGIASYKLPEELQLVDVLPRNPVGKVVKADLRAGWQVEG
ncbi:MAG: acyl--CoA ligase [Actinomycetia bacterium]|nr:acyl--CoA ligase [Actinomycetes bacterium]MCP4961350.1 acyl--CoA ligase [Actinomycetes bacterium]